MRIRLAIPDRLVTAATLDAALEAATRAAEIEQLSGEGPTFSELMRMGVKWRPENFTDGEHFDLPSTIARRKWGDCDDLAPALTAELRRQDPGAISRVVRSGPNRWHAVTQLSDGRILDASQMAGMRSHTGIVGAICGAMATPGRPAVALLPANGEWWARTDIPWNDWHLTSISHDCNVSRAMGDSMRGASIAGVGLGYDLSPAQWEPVVREIVSRHGPAVLRF